MGIEPVGRIIDKRHSYSYDASEPQTCRVVVLRPFALRNGSGIIVGRGTNIYVGAGERSFLLSRGLVRDAIEEPPVPPEPTAEELAAQGNAERAAELARVEQAKERERLVANGKKRKAPRR